MKPILNLYRRATRRLVGTTARELKAVTVFVTRGHEYTVNLYLRYHGHEVAKWVEVIDYESVVDCRTVGPSQIYVFTDLERLDRDGLARAARLWEAIGRVDPFGLRLNHPTRALRRYELLRLLDARGLNPFRAYRLTEHRSPRTFPVFIRREDDHPSGAPPLIHDEETLRAEIERIDAAGLYRDNLLVVEFCNVSDEAGHFRRYSSFNVNGEIIHRHLAVAGSWFCKGEARILNEATLSEELAFLRSDLYKEEILEIFRLARLDYGRMDYTVVDGRLVTWEINTAPSIMNAIGPNILHEVVAEFSCRFNAAFAKAAQLPCSRGG